MADPIKFEIIHPTSENETHEFEGVKHGDVVEFTYISEAEGGPVFTPRHIPAGV